MVRDLRRITSDPKFQEIWYDPKNRGGYFMVKRSLKEAGYTDAEIEEAVELYGGVDPSLYTKMEFGDEENGELVEEAWLRNLNDSLDGVFVYGKSDGKYYCMSMKEFEKLGKLVK